MRSASGILLSFMLLAPLPAADPMPTLRSIREISALSPEEAAKGYPVDLKGVVTFSKPEGATLFIHDGSQGIFITRKILPAGAGPSAGDHVRVKGLTEPGKFLPSIRGASPGLPSVEVLSAGPFPRPEPITGAEMAVPDRDCDWVSIEARVTEVSIRYDDLVLQCSAGPYEFFILIKGPFPRDSLPWSLAEYRIRARGVICTNYNSNRQMTRRMLRVSSLADIEILGPVFEQQEPIVLDRASDLFRVGGPGPADLVQIRGVATFAIPGQGYYLRTGDGSLWVQTAQPLAVSPGTVVEVKGRPRAGPLTPFINASESTLIGVTSPPTALTFEPAPELDPRFDSEYVTTEADLLGWQTSEDEFVLELRENRVVFRGTLPVSGTAVSPLGTLEIGSRIRLSGIARISTFPTHNPMVQDQTLTLRLRTPSDFEILSMPPFWTARKAFLCTLVAAVAMTALLIRNRRRRLMERETQRREFDAVLAERGRFAREIHDSLAQGLTSISLQLECVPDRIESAPDIARNHINRARDLIRDSIVEARRTIWNLRPLALGETDLATALRSITNQFNASGRIVFRQEIEGTPQPIPQAIENALLRIGQELLTNSVRHGSPSRVSTRLRYGPDWVTLIIRDDGSGFDVESRIGSGFGLTGMRERAAALDGSLTIESVPGQGTETSVTFPL